MKKIKLQDIMLVVLTLLTVYLFTLSTKQTEETKENKPIGVLTYLGTEYTYGSSTSDLQVLSKTFKPITHNSHLLTEDKTLETKLSKKDDLQLTIPGTSETINYKYLVSILTIKGVDKYGTNILETYPTEQEVKEPRLLIQTPHSVIIYTINS